MDKITINGTFFPPLTYGTIRRNKEAIDLVATSGLSSIERTEAAVGLLRLSAPEAPEELFDQASPGELMAAALKVYSASFSRPEEPAPETQSL